ncbi:MAG TPA: hypothetical protein QGG70_03860 [Candidatus Pacearchaeota archaeon]|jgi:hypothetical protein|nr:hypothetical protein [Candidatus Pacearchaeota archaeon]
MVPTYKGNVESLVKQFEEYKDTLDKRYREVLGDKCYEDLRRKSERVLVPECFFDTAEDYKKSLGGTLPENTPSKLLMLTDSEFSLDREGKIKEENARISMGFYINDNSFKFSGSSSMTDKIIASFIHEYDHFVYGALQKRPLYLVRNALMDELGETPFDLESLTKFVLKTEKEDRDETEKRKRLSIATNAYVMNGMWEDSTRILDKQILENIGIDVPLPFRGKKREYGMHTLKDPYITLAIPLGGDQFLGLEDKEVVHRVINWEEYMNQMGDNPFLDNFYDSLKNLNFNLMSLPELKKANESDMRKHKKSKSHKKTQELKKKLKRRDRRRK